MVLPRELAPERIDGDFEGIAYTMDRYNKEQGQIFGNDVKASTMGLINDANTYKRIEDGRASTLNDYGPNSVCISYYNAGLDIFQDGCIVRAKTKTGEEAAAFVDFIQREIAELTTVKELTGHTALESRDGKRSFIELTEFDEPFVYQIVMVCVNEF